MQGIVPDPFGRLLKAAGDAAFRNPFRFSTKYADDETGLVYYGHRHYTAEIGRWTRRDPADEASGSGLYAFVVNAPPGMVDPDGRLGWLARFLLCLRPDNETGDLKKLGNTAGDRFRGGTGRSVTDVEEEESERIITPTGSACV